MRVQQADELIFSDLSPLIFIQKDVDVSKHENKIHPKVWSESKVKDQCFYYFFSFNSYCEV